jgi:hypothetical protein
VTGLAPALTWPQILQRGTVAFRIDGHDFTMPPRPVAQWIAALDSRDLEDVVPGLLAEGSDEAWAQVVWNTERLFTGQLHRTIVRRVTTAAAGGMPWSAVEVLLGALREHWWDLDGWAVENHVDLLDLPLHRFCALLYHRMSANLEEKDRMALDSQLFAPTLEDDLDDPQAAPPGWSDAETAAAFTRALAAAPVRHPSGNTAGTPGLAPSTP